MCVAAPRQYPQRGPYHLQVAAAAAAVAAVVAATLRESSCCTRGRDEELHDTGPHM